MQLNTQLRTWSETKELADAESRLLKETKLPVVFKVRTITKVAIRADENMSDGPDGEPLWAF